MVLGVVTCNIVEMILCAMAVVILAVVQVQIPNGFPERELRIPTLAGLFGVETITFNVEEPVI